MIQTIYKGEEKISLHAVDAVYWVKELGWSYEQPSSSKIKPTESENTEPSPSPKFDANSALSRELEKVKGINRELNKLIRENRPYQNEEELKAIAPEADWDLILEQVYVESSDGTD